MDSSLGIKQEIIDESYDGKQFKVGEEKNATYAVDVQSHVCKEESEDGSKYAVYLQCHAEDTEEEIHPVEFNTQNKDKTHPAQIIPQVDKEIFRVFSTINNGSTRDETPFPTMMYHIPVLHHDQNCIRTNMTNIVNQNKGGNCLENDKAFRNSESRLQENEIETSDISSETQVLWHASSKELECCFCGKVFMKEKTLKLHLLIHNISDIPDSPPKRFHSNSKKNKYNLYCDICNKGFLYKSDLERHRRTHEDARPFICDVCGIGYKQQKSLNSHMATKHGDVKYINPGSHFKKHKCLKCPMSFTCESKLQAHQVVHTDDKPFVCNKCGKQYKYLHTLSEHFRSHSFDNPRKCQYCGIMFESRHRLKVHWIECAGDGRHKVIIKSHTCNICDKVFDSSYGLKRHQLSHTDERKFQCTICGLRFKQSAHLKGHVQSHEREKKIKKSDLEKKDKLTPIIPCPKCQYVFKTKAELKSHLLESANDELHCLPEKNKHICKDCKKVFDTKEGLDKHLQWHSEKRQFECSICKMSFKKTYHLKGHMCTHVTLMDSACAVTHVKDGEEKTMFECKECNAEFPTRKELKMHMIERGGDELHTQPKFVTSYQCEICDVLFSGNSGLLSHQRMHEKKHYECNECGEEFNQSEDLLKHGFIHKKRKKVVEKVKCNICSMEFNKKCELQVHIVESIGDGLHKTLNTYMTRGQSSNCKICGKFVPNKGGMKLHILKSHTQNKNDSTSTTTEIPAVSTLPKNTNFVDLTMQNDLQTDKDKAYTGEEEHNQTGSLMDSSPPMETYNQKEQTFCMFDINTEDKKADSFDKVKLQNCHSNLPERNHGNSDLLYESISNDQIVYTEKGIRYKCSECPKLLKKMNHIKRHMRIHQKNIKCEKCGKAFYHQQDLEEHINNQYQCSFCEERFCKVIEFKKHNRHHRKEKIIHCQHCPKRFHSEIQFAGHMSSHTGTRLFGCEICKFKFKNKSALETHMRRHNNDKRYLCDVCGKKFVDSSQLNMHHRIHDKVREIFKCDQCDKQYHYKEYLKYHINVQHNKYRSKCKICGKTFNHLNSLRLHERKHTGVKPFECDVCNKKFFTKNFLQVHSLVHTKLKTCECDICGSKFGQKAALYRHKKVMHASSKKN